jgi:hypothetical protein
VVGLDELYGGHRAEQAGLQGLLLGRHRAASGAALQGRSLAVADDAQVPVDAQIDDSGGEAAIVEAHAVDVAHGRRRHAVGRREQRDDRARLGIAADPGPGEGIEADQKRAARERQHDEDVVDEPIACLLRRRGRLDHPLLPGGRHREPAARGQASRRAEHDAARLLLHDGGVPALRARRCRKRSV